MTRNSKIIFSSLIYLFIIAIISIYIFAVSPVIPSIDHDHRVLEFLLVIQSLIWIYLSPKLIKENLTLILVLIGGFSIFTGILFDFYDEFVVLPYHIHLIEDSGKIIGFTFVTISLYLSIHNTNKKLSEEEKKNRIDSLTQLYNQRYLNESFKQTISNNYQELNPTIIAFIDIDNFKVCNDKFGHAKGDELLKKFSLCLKDNARDVDYVFRIGGEEFVIVFTKTSIQNAYNAIERIQIHFRKDVIKTFPGYEDIFTMSIGLKELTEDEDFEEAIHLADKAMYKSKHSGKNRITVYES